MYFFNEEDYKSEDSVTQEELFVMIQQFRRGKGKGKSKGKGDGVCWSCGESGHYSRDCPSSKHDGWTDAANIDETSESYWWMQSDSTGSEDDLHFCIVEKSENIAKGDKIENFESIVRDGQKRTRTVVSGDKLRIPKTS